MLAAAAAEARPIRPALRRLGMPTRTKLKLGAPTPAAPDTAAVPKLKYYGGPVIQSPEVYVIFWGPVAGEDAVLNFQTHVLQSPLFTLVQEYNTVNPAQTIGTGTFGGVVYDTDAPIDPVATDATIQRELARLIDLGRLPANTPGNRLYAIYFPPGMGIVQSSGGASCQAFCAYHDTFTLNGKNHYYEVIPDYTVPGPFGDCTTGCGSNPTPLEDQMSGASHELIEAVTDPGVGLVLAFGPPLGWYDPSNGEVGDICAYVVSEGLTNNFIVQNEWSNTYNACVDHVPSSTVSLDVSPATQKIAPGDSAEFQVTVTKTGGADLDVTPVAPDQFLPSGFTVTFDPPTISGSGTSTMTVTTDPAAVDTSSNSFIVALDGVQGYVPFVQPEVVISGPPPSVDPLFPAASGPSNGDAAYVVTISGSDLAPATVTFDGIPATDLGPDPFGGEDIVPPGHAPGDVKVVVTDVDGQVAQAGTYTYLDSDAPAVVKVLPDAGKAGDVIKFRLAHAGYDTTFDFGGVKADPNLIFADSNPIDSNDHTFNVAVTTPAHAAGKVTVTITTGDGQTATGDFTYGANPAPDARSLNVASGSTVGGQYAQVNGFFFVPGATIKVGGVLATPLAVAPSPVLGSFVSPGFAGFIVPPSSTVGVADVVITNPDGQSSTLANAFVYLVPAPEVTSLTPAFGATAGGQTVTIAGTGFGNLPKVFVDGAAATVGASTGTSISFTTPAHAVGPASVVVQNGDGQESVPFAFTYLAPAPTVTGISSSAGTKAGGQTVTLTGSGFVAPVTVSFGGAPATVGTTSANSVSVTTPALLAGDALVVVTNPDGQSSVPVGYTFLEAAPTVTSLNASSGSTSGQLQVTVAGGGFAPGATVTFGGDEAWVLKVSATSIDLLTPPHPEGKVDVVVTNQDGQAGTLAGAFTYSKSGATGPTPDAGTSSGGSNGGGCSVAAGSHGAGSALWLLGLLVIARRRRR
jgi:MYXO-CTERM domain-containing protein